MSEHRDDAYWIDRVTRGEREAFRVLVERYHAMVYGIAMSMTRNPESAQDAVQEVFYRAYRKLSAYNPQYPFGVWLRRITVNHLLDQRKKKRVDTVSMTTDEGTAIDVADGGETPRCRQYRSDREEMVLEAIQTLPDKYRMVLMLRHFEDLSYEEIAKTLSLPLGTVMTQLHRARAQLANALQSVQAELLT